MDVHIYSQPRVMRSMNEITAVMGVGRETVLEWISRGAPVAVEMSGGKKVYSAEAGALQRWRVEMSGRRARRGRDGGF